MDTMCSWIRWLNIVKILIFPKYRFNAVPIKIPAGFFADPHKQYQSFHKRAKVTEWGNIFEQMMLEQMDIHMQKHDPRNIS